MTRSDYWAATAALFTATETTATTGLPLDACYGLAILSGLLAGRHLYWALVRPR